MNFFFKPLYQQNRPTCGLRADSGLDPETTTSMSIVKHNSGKMARGVSYPPKISLKFENISRVMSTNIEIIRCLMGGLKKTLKWTKNASIVNYPCNCSPHKMQFILMTRITACTSYIIFFHHNLQIEFIFRPSFISLFFSDCAVWHNRKFIYFNRTFLWFHGF